MSINLAEDFRAAIFAETNDFTVGVRKINGLRLRLIVDSIQQLKTLTDGNDPEAKEVMLFLAGTTKTSISAGGAVLSLPVSLRPTPQSPFIQELVENIFPGYTEEQRTGRKHPNLDQLNAANIVKRLFKEGILDIELPQELKMQIVDAAKKVDVVIAADQVPAIFARGPSV